MCFEALGPTYIKFGQMLAARPDLISAEFSDEFRKLQDQVPALGMDEIEGVLKKHFKRSLTEVFSFVDPQPIGAASIAQVHRAILSDSTAVVIKVQRPGIEQTIEEDIAILYNLAELVEKYIPEWRRYHPKIVVEEFARTLELETNFSVEANSLRRFAQNFADDGDIRIPQAFVEYSGRRVLVMEELKGVALSQYLMRGAPTAESDEILRRVVRTYLRMVFIHGFFHGDLHAGNVFLLDSGQIGLIDFGAVGRLNRRTQTAVADMLLALAEEDYERLAFTYVDLAPFSDVADIDEFARQLRDLIAPYFGLTLRNVNTGRLLLQSASLAYEHGLILPADLVLFFKSLVAVEGLGRVMSPGFDFLTLGLQFADELMQSRLEPKRVAKDIGQSLRDLNTLLVSAPRQLRWLLRKWGQPDFRFKVEIEGLAELRAAQENGDRLRFLGLLNASLILVAGMLLIFKNHEGPPFWWALGLLTLVAWISFVALFFPSRK